MHPILLTVTEAELTDTPEGDHLKSNRPKERRVSRTYTAHKALLEASVLRSIKDWNLPRDEGTEDVGRGVTPRTLQPPAASSASPKVSPKVARPSWRHSLQEKPNLEQHTSDRRFSLPVQPERPERHTSDKFMRPDISKTENRMYETLTCPSVLPPARTKHAGGGAWVGGG